jgi:two-component system, OmpR family, sensor kinase
MPPPLQERLGELQMGQEARFRFGDGSRMFAAPVESPKTGAGHVLLFTHQEGNPGMSRQSLLYLQLLTLLCAAAIVGWLAARALTSPIRRMQSAVNRVASGDLDSRVGSTLDSSVGELVALARDIDHMAAHMQTMMIARTRLFHHLSHEMRSPLARLRILLELLRDTGYQGEVSRLHERLNLADHEVSRLDSLIDEILDLARFDASKPPPMKPLSLTEVISECVELNTMEAKAKSVRLCTEFDKVGSTDMVSGNQELIVRAVDNLLRNAIRYTPANGAVIISLKHDGDKIILSVADEGPGVPEAFVNTIFEPFFRVPVSKSHTGTQLEKGYGLGLTFVHLVANLHAANIAARNKKSGGLSIVIRFNLIPHATHAVYESNGGKI